MAETVDLNTYMSYVLIAAYYVIMLRLWLPPPPSAEHEEAGDDKAVVTDGASSRAALRQMAPSLAGDYGEPASSTEARRPDEPLERIRAADERFDEREFLSGASQAYELVVNAYAKGDTAILDDLLGAEAAEAFGKAIDERQEKGERLMIDFIGIRELDIVDAGLEADLAEITVRFVAELVTVTRAIDKYGRRRRSRKDRRDNRRMDVCPLSSVKQSQLEDCRHRRLLTISARVDLIDSIGDRGRHGREGSRRCLTFDAPGSQVADQMLLGFVHPECGSLDGSWIVSSFESLTSGAAGSSCFHRNNGQSFGDCSLVQAAVQHVRDVDDHAMHWRRIARSDGNRQDLAGRGVLDAVVRATVAIR